MDSERLLFLFDEHTAAVASDYDLEVESGRLDAVERFLGLADDTPNRTLMMAVRSIAVAQILLDEPPETWSTVQRLRAGGYGRDEVLEQLELVVHEHVAMAMAMAGDAFDAAGFVDSLESLPLPTATDIARALIAAARAQPGIDAGEHVAVVAAEFAMNDSGVAASMVDGVLESLSASVLHWLPGDETVVVSDLIDGCTFVHRLSDVEAELGVLTAGFDLGAFAHVDTLRFDGVVVEQFSVAADHLGWRAGDGWLDGFEPGSALGVTIRLDDDRDELEPLDAVMTIGLLDPEPAVTEAVTNAVRAGYDNLVAEPGLSVSGEELALWLLFHHRQLFDGPQPSLTELCAAAGLERRGGRVAHDETIWRNDVFHRRFWHVNDLVPEAEWRHVLANALQVLDDPDAAVEVIRNVLGECAEPETLDVLADVLIPHHLDLDAEFDRAGADSPGRLFDLVNRATTVARRPREIATAEYLACVLHERCGAPEIAELHLQRALDAQPRLGPVVERVGWYRFDRGDARGAMRQWRTLSDLPDAAATIQPFLTPSTHPKLGRNDPCWCGSGRKFKHCHQDSSELPALADRVGWLCRKASLWLEHATDDVAAIVTELATARATGHADADVSDFDADELVELFDDALRDPIVFDTALREEGLFALFMHERAALLPADEQLLAASWRTVDRSVHEVLAVKSGVGVVLRDLATGDVADVRERTASAHMRVGERYCARVVPDGETSQLIGGIFGVRTGHETTVLDLCAAGDGVALCAWAGALSQPPQLVHTPGLAEDMFDLDAIESVLAGRSPLDDGAVTEQLGSELSRQAQRRWLDEHIPALGGLTPREAAEDPTRREQLERLLDELDTVQPDPSTTPGGFIPINYDTAALRRELGLS